MDLTEPLSEEEYERLCGFMQYQRELGHSIMPAGMLDGFLTALACGPEIPMPSEWLEALWGGEEPEFKGGESEAEAILGLLIRVLNGRHATLAFRAPLYPRFAKNDKGTTMYEWWCLGFREGMRLRWSVWGGRLEEMEEVLSPILALGGDPDDPERQRLLRDRGTVARLAALIPECVQVTYDLWHEDEEQERDELSLH